MSIRTALVTGSANGIGRAIALRLAEDGFQAAINDLASQDARLKELQHEIELKGKRCIILPADVSSEDEVAKMMQNTVQMLGGLDVMIANAGIILVKPLLETSAKNKINVRGVFLCYKHAGLEMIKQGRGGKIIGACSISGYRPSPQTPAYSVSKWAIRGLTQVSAMDLAQHGITVNAYCPGMVRTDMWETIDSNLSTKMGIPKGMAFEKAVESRIASKRAQTPEDISGLVSFLAGKDSDQITGQSLIVDGGMFSWLSNPEWKEFYSSATEIQDYLHQCCGKENLYDAIKTSHRVDHAEWNDSEGVWSLRIVDEKSGKQFHDYCHFLLDGMGIPNNWTWPDIPGLHDFSGPLIHSANWPKDFNYDGLTVAVIGNGATGVQIVPAILPDVKHMVHVVRSPSWIAPPGLVNLSHSNAASILSKIDIDENGNFTATQIKKFKESPEDYSKFVKAIELETNQNFSKFMIKDSNSQAVTRGRIEEYMRNMLNNDEVLCKAFIPDFPLGCRRLTPGVGYLEALQDPKFDIVTDTIKRVVPNGIVTSTGKLLKVDAIICATGFDVSFRPRFPIIGRNGNLQDTWFREVPKAYMSCAVTSMPNYFIFLGPNAPIGHGSYFTITEHIAKYIAGIIIKCQTQGIKSIAPSESAANDYFEHIQEFMPRITWSGNCRSWFKQGKKDGPVVALHPGSRIHFFDMLRDFRGEDWVFTYQASNRGNRFRYLGNGISARELDGSDCTWYLDEPDNLS